LQGVPGVYFHSLFGSRGDRTGAEVSGIPRRINREKLSRHRLEAELGLADSLRSRVWRGLRELLRVRGTQSAFHPQAAQQVFDADDRLFALCRVSPGGDEVLLCLQNVSDHVAPASALLAKAPPAEGWTDLLTGKRYGRGGARAADIEPAGYQTMWLRADKAR